MRHDELREMESAIESITGGEWNYTVFDETPVPATLYSFVEGEEVDIATFEVWEDPEYSRQMIANAQFIIRAPGWLHDLIEDLKAKKKLCKWVHDEEHEKWDTACGEAFCFIEDGPKENKMRFCCYCGGELIEHRPQQESEES